MRCLEETHGVGDRKHLCQSGRIFMTRIPEHSGLEKGKLVTPSISN